MANKIVTVDGEPVRINQVKENVKDNIFEKLKLRELTPLLQHPAFPNIFSPEYETWQQEKADLNMHES